MLAWKIIRVLIVKGDCKMNPFSPQNALSKSKQPKDCSLSGKLFVSRPSHFLNILTLPQLVSQPHNPLDSTAEIKCTHAGAVIQFIFSLGFLCSVPGSFVRPSLTPNCCTCAAIETPLPPSRPPLPSSSWDLSPNHLFPRHKSSSPASEEC